MQFISSKLKKFDVHTKTEDGVTVQTVMGAVITVFSSIVIAYLVFSTISTYMKRDSIGHMVVDTSVGLEDLRIVFDINFPSVICDKLTVKQEVTRGTLHHPQTPDNIVKIPSVEGGCDVSGSMVTDKAGGNFVFQVEPTLDEAHIQEGGQLTPPDISHNIRALQFLPVDINKYDFDKTSEFNTVHKQHPLNGQSSTLASGSGMVD